MTAPPERHKSPEEPERHERVEARRFVVEERPHQYTYEGTIELLGDFAASANRAGGWRRLVARIFVVLMLAPIVVLAVALFMEIRH